MTIAREQCDFATHSRQGALLAKGLIRFAACAFSMMALLVPVLHAQNYLTSTGTSSFSVPEPAEMGTVDAATGNLHLEIPLGSFPQRADSSPLVPKLLYDSHIWTVPTDGSSKVWTTQGSLYGLAFGTWGFHEGGASGLFYMAASGQGCNVDYMLWSDAGVQHFFNIPGTWNGAQCSGGTAYATDGSGYQFRQTAWGSGVVAQVSVFAPDGTEVWGSDLYNAGVASKDSNGNYLALTTANSIPPGIYNPILDTLGRKVVNQSTVGNVTTLQVLNSQGGTANYVITTATIPVKTHFLQSGITECTTNCTATVIRTIGLPDGSSYSFLYDCDSTTGNSACNTAGGQAGYYGTLTKMTLPTGGVVTYGYTNFKDALGGMSRWLISKSASGSCCWSYSPAVVNSTTQKVTVSRPDYSKEAITFTVDAAGGAWPTQRATYDTDGVTLLSTVNDTWYFDVACTLNVCGGKGHQNVRRQRTSTTLPMPSSGNITRTTTYTYDSPQKGNVTAIKEWKYLNGTAPTFPAVPDRATFTTFATIGTNNNINRPTSITICSNVGTDADCPGGGSKAAKTTISYDAYGTNGSLALGSVTGIASHDDSKFGSTYLARGNPTHIARWVSGTSYLTTALSYDSTGQVVKSVDPAANPTYFYYAPETFYSDNGANPPAVAVPAKPTNAYVMKVTDPIGSVTMGYYLSSGKLAVVSDYNGDKTYNHFVNSSNVPDPFDRPTKAEYPVGWELNVYTSPTQADSYSAVNDASASSSCVSCVHTQAILDALGRVTTQNLVNNPAGVVSQNTGYDGLSRVANASHPHIGSTDPNYVFETASYDGLGRALVSSHPDGQAARQAYGANMGASGGVITQQGSTATYGYGFPVLSMDEARKQRQEWMDGFGRVIEVDEPSTGATIDYANVVINGSEGSYTWYPCGVSSCPTTVYDSGSVSITVNGFTATASYNQGSSSVSMASALASVFNANVNSPVTASAITGAGCFPGWACIVYLKTKAAITTPYAISTSATSYDPSHFPTASFYGTTGPFMLPTITSPSATFYTYDVLGNLTQVVQGSQSRTYQYDGLGRLTREVTPEAGTITLSYLNASSAVCSGSPQNPCSRTDARGIVTTFTYDAAGRPTTKTHSDTTGTVTFTYDTGSHGKGRLAKVTDPSGSESYTYDSIGRATTIAKVIGSAAYTTSYTYNAADEITQITYPSGRIVKYGYDSVGHLCVVATSVTDCTTYTNPFLTVGSAQYDAAARPLTATYGNGVVKTAAYSPQTFELSSLSYAKGATQLFGLSYFYQKDSSNCPTGNVYGNNGQIQCITDTVQPGRSVKYTYDALGRLNTANTAGSTGYPAWGLSETYDRYGNRTAQTVTAGSGFNLSLSINAANNRINGYTYDNSGNITASPSNAATFSYDGEQCNTTYVGSGSNATYTCDANHLRVKKIVTGTSAVTTLYVRSGAEVLAEYDNGAGVTSPTREFIYADDPIAIVSGSSGGSGGTIAYEQRDHLSPRLFTDAAGNDIGEEGTYPFGEAWYSNSAAKNWVFTSYERDPESGNDYAMAREYSGTQGRFLSPDPWQGHVGDPQSWNRYAYVENDPINLNDPSGQGFWADLFVAIATVFVDIFFPPAIPLMTAVDVAAGAETAAEKLQGVLVATSIVITACKVVETGELCGGSGKGGAGAGGKDGGNGSSTTGTATGSEGGGDPSGQGPSRGGAGTADPSPSGAGGAAGAGNSGGGWGSGGSIWDECGTRCMGGLAWAANFSAGAGSALTLGLTDLVNHFTGAGQVINRKSGAYWAGFGTGAAIQTVLVPYFAGPKSFLARSVLNHNRYIRLGWNYFRGAPTYRLVIGSAAAGLHAHLDLYPKPAWQALTDFFQQVF